MSLEGYTKVPIKKIGGRVTNFASETVPSGISPDCRNVRFTLNSVAVRYGIQQTISTGKGKAVNSIGMLIRTGMTTPQFPLMFNADGSLCFEPAPLVAGLPVASSATQDLIPTLGTPAGKQMFTWNAATYLGMSASFQRMYMVNGDLKVGVGSPAVTDGTNLDPLSQRPWGEFWAANTLYNVGEIVSPTPANGHVYRVTVGGVSGAAQPAFSIVDSSVLNEGPSVPQLQFTEYTLAGGNVVPAPLAPTIVKVPGAGTYAVARDVYIFIDLVNGNGETTGSPIQLFVNTVLNDRFQVQGTILLAWVAALPGLFAVTGYRVYAADVATGAAAPVLASFHLIGATTAVNVNVNVDASGAGAAPPTANSARITIIGNIAAGQRFAAVAFVNRFDNISGFNIGCVVPIDIDVNIFELFMANIPIGPANCLKRILILGVALGSNGGPFFYIDVNQSTGPLDLFVINDNKTTTGVFNFTDDKLGAATDATNLSRKIKLPPQVDIQYISGMKRFVTCGESGQPSLSRFSNASDPESFYGDTGFQYAARDNGQRTITHREYQNTIAICFKEEQAFSMVYDNTDPINWPFESLWKGSGPAGPRAVDTNEDLLLFGHKSGAYLWQGSGDPVWISQEIDDDWKRINWDFGHKICVTIDVEEKEVHFHVPFGGSTENNIDFCVNYKRGWEDPVVYSSFTGKEIAKPLGRKWSMNDIACTQSLRAKRRVVQADGTVLLTNMLFASPYNLDSGVMMTQPNTYSDNGKGYDAHYDTSTVGDGSGVFSFGGIIISAKGNGKVQLYGIPYHGPNLPLKPKTLSPDKNSWYTAKAPAGHKSRQWGFGISNGSVAGVYWEFFEGEIAINASFDQETSYASSL